MTCPVLNPQHQAFIAHKTSLMTEIFGNLYDGYAEEVDDVADPALYGVTSDLSHLDAPATLEGPSLEDVLSRCAEDAKRLICDLFDAILSEGDRTVASSYLWTISGLDLRQVNGDHTSGKPRVHTAAFVPPHLEARFQAWLASSGPTHLGVTAVEKLGRSKEAVAPAVDHVLQFARAWRPIVDRSDLASKFLILFTDREYGQCREVAPETPD